MFLIPQPRTCHCLTLSLILETALLVLQLGGTEKGNVLLSFLTLLATSFITKTQ